MGLHFTFGRDCDIAKLHAWITRFTLTTLRCRGFFIGNTFIGIVRARK
jgi:Ni,Fe-hydrogenase I cytochrome b subunit